VTIVVKLGSSLVTDGSGRIRRSLLTARAAEIGSLARGGERVCVVSSGAIALGLARLGFARRPRATPRLQAASAVGQAQLQRAWDGVLRREGLDAAQILLSAADLADRASYVNLRNAFDALLRLGIVPVVNENDATATDEITFGDNDALAAQVAVLARARLLVLLTEVDGVYTAHPATPGAELLSEGDTAEGLTLGRGSLGHGSPLGRGGMASKIAAARLAAGAGIPTVIASGRGRDVLGPIVAGERRGTRFAARETAGATAFRLWLRHAKPAAARLVVDEGAHGALVAHGRSLLAVGVVRCEGTFVPGDAVELADPDGTVFAKGIAGAGSADLSGRPRGLEVVHRDRLVLYTRSGAGEGGRVTAPSDADETSAAYFASTPDS
jgi:glutamate 5-kinase